MKAENINETSEQIGFLVFGLNCKMIIPFLERKNRFGKEKSFSITNN